MKKVLVVDDSALIHSMMKQVLSTVGDCKAEFARNGQEALDQIGRSGEPNLILLDVNMPIMDGLECLDELRARGITERVPVVLVTTEGQEDDVRRGMAGGAKAYFKKPFDPIKLKAAIEKLLTPKVVAKPEE